MSRASPVSPVNPGSQGSGESEGQRRALLGDLIAAISPPDHPLPQLADREVDEDVLATLLGAARVAPSADNLQPCRTISVRSPDTRRELARAVPGPLAESVEAAPVVLVACGVRAVLTRARREQPFVLMDVPIAVTHILLQAEELSLACAWTLELDEEMVRRALGIPEDVRVLALLCLGWPGRPRAI